MTRLQARFYFAFTNQYIDLHDLHTSLTAWPSCSNTRSLTGRLALFRFFTASLASL
jgi:hypothetical protein